MNLCNNFYKISKVLKICADISFVEVKCYGIQMNSVSKFILSITANNGDKTQPERDSKNTDAKSISVFKTDDNNTEDFNFGEIA